MKKTKTYVKALRMGWGEGSVYFSTEADPSSDEYVDAIYMTEEHTVMGWLILYGGRKNGKTVFEIYNANNVTLYYKTIEMEE